MIKCFSIFLFIIFYANLQTFAGHGHHKAKNAKAIDIDSLYFFEPVTSISLISEQNKEEYNDSLSQLSKGVLIDAINSFSQEIKLSGEISVTDLKLKRAIAHEITYILLSAYRKKYYEELNVKTYIDSILDAQGKICLTNSKYWFHENKS